MINLIYGANGSGKTQKLIDLANAELEKTNGLIVYLDKSDSHRIAISPQIRFINVTEFDVNNADLFIGLLCGLVSGNYDINRIYIDNLHKIIGTTDAEAILDVLGKIRKLCEMNEMSCCVTINFEDVPSDKLNEYTIL